MKTYFILALFFSLKAFSQSTISDFRSCATALNELSSQEKIGFSPWGNEGNFILPVDLIDIEGAQSLYETHRNKPNSSEKDAALSSTYLLISQNKVQSFVIPNFRGSADYIPMGRIKVGAEYFYYRVDALGAPNCFYDESGLNINPYKKVELTCPKFDQATFNYHNENAKKNSRVKVENGKHYSFVQEVTNKEMIIKTLEKKINDQLKNIIFGYKKEWRETIVKSQTETEKVNEPAFMKYLIVLNSQECIGFQGIPKALVDINIIQLDNKIILDYYNKESCGNCN